MTPIYQEFIENSDRLKEEFFQLTFSRKVLITYSVETSTIRAIQNTKKYKPLSLFRVWANNYLSDPLVIKRLNSRKDFEGFRKSTRESLKTFWKEKDKSLLKSHLLFKLIDLFIKFLPLWTELDVKTKNWIFENANVPLDKFSLLSLSEINPELGIKKNPSMGHISNEKTYEKMQLAIRNMCKKIPAITFDLFAWERGHKTFELQLKEPK